MERKLRWGLRGGFEELHSLERVHSEGNVHAGAVGEEGSQGGLLEQSEDQDLVPETHMGRVQIQENQKKMAKNSWWTVCGSQSALTSCLAGRRSSSWSYR